MKFLIFLTIFFIFFAKITSNNNKEDFSFSKSEINISDPKSVHDSIYDIIRSTNGNIFTHMRNVKQDFHPDIQKIFEKSIKDYEYRYISDKEEFVRFMFDKYQELEYFEKNQKKEIEAKYKEETSIFLKEVVSIYNQLDEKEKKEFHGFVEKQDKFTKDLLEFAIKHHIIFDDSKFKDVGTIIQTIPDMLFANQNLNKIKEIKGKINIKGEEIKVDNSYTNTNKTNKISYARIKNNPQFKNSEKNLNKNNYLKNNRTRNHSEDKKKEFVFSPPSTTLNKNFTNFLNNLTSEFNLTNLHAESHSSELKKLILNDISGKLNDNHKKSFSMFLQEYIQEAVYNNDLSLVSQFNNHNSNYMNDYDLSRFKSEETMKDDGEDPPKPSTDTMGGATKIGAKITAIKVAKDRVEDILLGRKTENFGTNPTCEAKEEEIKEFVAAKAEEIKKKQSQLKIDLPEIPKDILNIGLDFDGMPGILKMIIMKFIGKMAGLIASHIPFYFFKFCLPPGPLTWGCCPEASFFPTQIYNLFTIFDKVEKFKSTARNYPSWLQSIDRGWFPEPLYYICAQGYLTMHESALFNMCDPRSMIWFNYMNLMGLLPGDFPVCFVTCIQAMIMCLTPFWELGPCDAMINIFHIIAAIFDISARFRLMGTFIGTCTYIPFLIRWDLVPPWKKENKASHDDPLDDIAHPKPEPVCEESKPEPISPYQEELSKQGIDVKIEVPHVVPPPEKYERGFRTKMSAFEIVKVDIYEEGNVGHMLHADSPVTPDVNYYPADFVYMISNHGDFSSEERKKRFPFHVKTYLINQN